MARTRVAELEQERQDADDDGGSGPRCRQSGTPAQSGVPRRGPRPARDINGKNISLQAKPDVLADTLDNCNASGALEADADIVVIGRLTDFIRIEDGWEEAVAHALGGLCERHRRSRHTADARRTRTRAGPCARQGGASAPAGSAERRR